MARFTQDNKMSFFEDDSFDGIVKEFFGGAQKKYDNEVIQGEEEDRFIDFIEDKEKVYFVFELSGYSEDEVKVVVSGNILEIVAQKKREEGVQNYLMQKLGGAVSVKKNLPKFVRTKNFNKTMRNGILEVIFDRK